MSDDRTSLTALAQAAFAEVHPVYAKLLGTYTELVAFANKLNRHSAHEDGSGCALGIKLDDKLTIAVITRVEHENRDLYKAVYIPSGDELRAESISPPGHPRVSDEKCLDANDVNGLKTHMLKVLMREMEPAEAYEFTLSLSKEEETPASAQSSKPHKPTPAVSPT